MIALSRRRGRAAAPPPSTSARPPHPAAPSGGALAVEGFFQSVGQGVAGSYLSAFALWLGAGGVALGLVGALPTAMLATSQVLARRVRAGAGGARGLIGRAWLAQSAGYAALGLCAFLAPPLALPILCAVIVLVWGSGGLVDPAWTALVSRVVPRARHGWFFALRGASQQGGMLVATLGGGLLLAWLTARGHEGIGFLLIFVLAGLARLGGTGLLVRVADPDGAEPGRQRPRGLGRLPGSRKGRRLAYYLWALHFGTHLSNPFFIPYMVRDLRMSYGVIGALVAVPPLVKIATVRWWGRMADRTGPGPILRASGWLVSLVPALWLVSDSPWWILAAQVYGGVVWGAFELSQASSILQATRGRERDVALFNAVDGCVLLAGALAGGVLVSAVDRPGLSGYAVVLLLSTLVRLAPASGLLWRVRGLGRPGWSHLRIPMRLWGVRPTGGLAYRPLAEIPPQEKGEPGSGAPVDPIRRPGP